MTDIKLSYVSSINAAMAEELVKHTNAGSSGFRWWLSNYRSDTVAMVVYSGDAVIGWAACRVGNDFSEIGVFIDPPYRRKGIATIAFDALLLRLKREHKAVDVPMDFDRETCMTRLMADHLEHFGFIKFEEKAA